MLAISEGQRLTCEEVQMIILLQEKASCLEEDKNYHWSVAKELVMVEAER